MDKHEIAPGPFQATWESLRTFECPQWFRDAKLGIWSHWGPQSVPMYGDWYARNMYIEGKDQYRYHIRRYGHPSKFGYKDVVALWKAENFDPEGLMDLFVRAGAKYFVGQAAHHDNFHNWNSKHHRWNSVKVGPGKDICALWCKAARDRGLPFGLTEHIATTFSWLTVNKGADKEGPYAGVPYDGNDEAYRDLYVDNFGAEDISKEWYTTDPRWPEKWFSYVKDFIDQFEPELLYSDGGLPFGQAGLEAVAHLYNTSAKRHGGVSQAVYNQKDKTEDVRAIGVFDIERSFEADIRPYVWQTDTSVGDWFYDVRDVYKTPKYVAETLVDIVAKNGNLLLNVPQRPDGTLDDECLFLLRETGKWLDVVGEGIFATRPWTVYGEGPSAVEIATFKEDVVHWTIEDFRFTQKGSDIYAFLMKWPEGGRAVIRSLAQSDVRSVELLGHGPIPFSRDARGLALDLPMEKPCSYLQCVKVGLADK
jgi:alpha-L-fucosidase